MAVGVDKSDCKPKVFKTTLFKVLVVDWVMCFFFCSVEHEEGGESRELNEGVGRYKFDGEVCGWDE